jgi:hypothetical protein
MEWARMTFMSQHTHSSLSVDLSALIWKSKRALVSSIPLCLKKYYFPKPNQFFFDNFHEMHIKFSHEIFGENWTFDANMGFQVIRFEMQPEGAMFLNLLRGGLEWNPCSPPVCRPPALYSRARSIQEKQGVLCAPCDCASRGRAISPLSVRCLH